MNPLIHHAVSPAMKLESQGLETANKPGKGVSWWFALLSLCWCITMLYPSLFVANKYLSQADNAVMTLMAAVILLALRTALQAGEHGHAAVFSGAELLYCGAY